jgi:hypothetical protein
LSDAVANLIASKFIQRKDVKAIQFADGSWMPHTTTGKREGDRLPWKRPDLLAHLSGERTFGHYLLDADSQCKLFAFDVDLEKTGEIPLRLVDPFATDEERLNWHEDERMSFISDLRGTWLERSNPARAYMKFQFREIGHKLMQGIYETLGLPCAAAYSGGKGIHVYAFTGIVSATEAREGAQIVLDALGGFEATRGTNFFKHSKWHNLSIEVFPKQDSLDGKDLGNLMRLPLGRNLKSKDPTFFIDMTSPLGEMRPVDPEWALTTSNPWARPGE